MPAVLLATCATLPSGDEDAALLVAALAARGVDAQWAAWTDPTIDWSVGLVVLRSTWDYATDREAFLEWVCSVPSIANDARVVAWNCDKVYLRDLDLAGIPIVPTTFVEPTETLVLFGPDAPHAGARELVVKPAVGAGSRGAGRFPADQADAAQEHLEKLLASGGLVLVQPYLEAVDDAGETSLVYLDGRFSHAIRKGPMLPPGSAHPLNGPELYVEERIEAREATPAELRVGEATVATVRERFGADQLYTRVDLLPTPEGPVVVELELIEPSLFLQFGEGTAPVGAFAAAIAARA